MSLEILERVFQIIIVSSETKKNPATNTNPTGFWWEEAHAVTQKGVWVFAVGPGRRPISLNRFGSTEQNPRKL